MSDYEELIKNLRSVKDTWQTQEEEWMLQAADAIEKLKALTAADVKPVVHGFNTKGCSLFECSECGWECWDTYCCDKCDTESFNFCPNCGADMRKLPEEKK